MTSTAGLAEEMRLGSYLLRERLAIGGMAEIFLALRQGLEGFEKKVVVKRILPHVATDPDFVHMFVDEAKLAAQLNHPSIVQVDDFGSVDETYFIAMEYVDGMDLRGLFDRASRAGRRITPAEAAAIGESAARGLAFSHAATDDAGQPLGIVHRDVSPQNVMISRSGYVKITDFGIARACQRRTKTQTGVLKGKIAYMAPEYARDMPSDGRADQFSLGLVIWEALTGRRFYEGDSDLRLIHQVYECKLRPARELNPTIPVELDNILSKALSREPEDRFADAGALADALQRFRFGLGTGGIVDLAGLVEALSTVDGGHGAQAAFASRPSPIISAADVSARATPLARSAITSDDSSPGVSPTDPNRAPGVTSSTGPGLRPVDHTPAPGHDCSPRPVPQDDHPPAAAKKEPAPQDDDSPAEGTHGASSPAGAPPWDWRRRGALAAALACAVGGVAVIAMCPPSAKQDSDRAVVTDSEPAKPTPTATGTLRVRHRGRMLRVSLRTGESTEYLGETPLTRPVPVGRATLILAAAADPSLRTEVVVDIAKDSESRVGCDTRLEPEQWKCVTLTK